MLVNNALTDLLAGAVPLFEGDKDALIEWAENVQEADGKILPGAGFGMDTTGRTIDIQDRVGDEADIKPGTFDDGWIALPATGEGSCRRCEGKQPAIAVGHAEDEILLLDCVNCQTRYSVDALEGDHDA